MRKLLHILAIQAFFVLLCACAGPRGNLQQFLHDTIFSGDFARAEGLLANGADVNAKLNGGTTLLHVAAYRRNIQAMKFLIERGANVNARDKRGDTPLYRVQWLPISPKWVTPDQQKTATELLLFNGADANIQNDVGLAPLHILALWWDEKELVELYVSNGADVNIVVNDTYTPLDLAVDRENNQMADALRGHGGRYHNPLRVEILTAARKGNLGRIKEFADEGADVFVHDIYGRTPLHFATACGHIKIVRFLLEKGADVNRSSQGKTPLDMAKSEEMEELLRKYGAVSGKELRQGEK